MPRTIVQPPDPATLVPTGHYAIHESDPPHIARAKRYLFAKQESRAHEVSIGIDRMDAAAKLKAHKAEHKHRLAEGSE